MEIRKIEIENEIKYPRINEVDTRDLRNSKLDKWKRMGIISLVLNLFMRVKSYASSNIEKLNKDVEEFKNVSKESNSY